MAHRVNAADAARIAKFHPASGMETPRFAGVASFMRLPCRDPNAAEGVEIGLVGIPFDGATTNRPGARLGPRGVREASTGTRAINHASGIAPYALAACADLGDVAGEPGRRRRDLPADRGVHARARGLPASCRSPSAATTSSPIRSSGRWGAGARSGSCTSTPTATPTTRSTAAPGSPTAPRSAGRWRTACSIRGAACRSASAAAWARRTSATGPAPRASASSRWRRRPPAGCRRWRPRPAPSWATGPTYLSFDIDSLDPAYAPGTGTPEVGGLTTREALALLRSLRGLDLVGADLVEVAPPLDPSGLTALTGGQLAFEILCLLADATAARRAAREASDQTTENR